jgi:hypothetical protein
VQCNQQEGAFNKIGVSYMPRQPTGREFHQPAGERNFLDSITPKIRFRAIEMRQSLNQSLTGLTQSLNDL